MTAVPSFGAHETPLASLSGELLRARVARAQMYLIEMEPKESASIVSRQLERDRLAYFYRLEQQGCLFAAGPLEKTLDRSPAELAVLAAVSPEEARRIAAQEPGHLAGAYATSVRSYTINEGVACYFARAMSKRVGPSADVRRSDLSREALLAKAVEAELYVVFLEPTDKPRPAEDTATIDSHFVWLRENEMAARLMACGPLQSTRALVPGAWGGGLGIFATSRAQAREIAAVEPSGVAGYRELSVTRWTVNFGLAAPIAKALATLNSLGNSG